MTLVANNFKEGSENDVLKKLNEENYFNLSNRKKLALEIK